MDMGDDLAISARGLTKSFRVARRRPGVLGGLRSIVQPVYEVKTAVEDLSLDVARGEIVALLGPNGAGKSTAIKMLTGILVPTAGELHVNGLTPHKDRVRNARGIGAVFGQRTQLWWDLPARDSFAILRDIFGVPAAAYRERVAQFDEILDLSEFWETPVRHLSLGQRVRCDLAAALLHDPAIVFLDEPTIGMDVVVKEQVREFLRYQVAERGRTVVLTTHDMTEVARLCERAVLVNHGRLIFDGSLDELRERYGTTWHVKVTLAEAVEDPVIPGARVVARDGARLTLAPDGAQSQQELVRAVMDRYQIVDLALEESDLEDLMRQIYRRRAAVPS
jgi:ABC-2 type transport system ATP-binding protein